jgi:hypothetical protein
MANHTVCADRSVRPAGFAGRVSHPLYVFCVAAAATFLCGIVALRPSLTGYLATAIIECDGGSTSGNQPPAELAGFGDTGVRLQQAEGTSCGYVASCVKRDQRGALSALDNWLAEVQQRTESAATEQRSLIRQYAAEAEAARMEALQAQRELVEWDKQALGHGRSSNAPPTTPLRSAEPNPQWVELFDALENKRAKRTALLADRLPAHPLVQNIEFQIAELELSLADTPRFLTDSQPPAPLPPVVEAHDAAPAERERLVANLSAAMERLSTTELQWRKAAETLPAAPAMTVRVVRPAEVVAAIGGSPRLGVTVSIALAGVLVGLAFARATYIFSTPGVFTSVGEINAVLGLPVVGALSTGDGPTIPSPGKSRKFALRVFIHLAEATAILLLIAAIAGIAVDGLAARTLLSDPVQALTLAWKRFLPF